MRPASGMSQHDFLFRGTLHEVAPFVADLIDWEAERQARKLILIPSESYAPRAIREALGSVFQNIYAEGYPPTRMTRDPEERLQDVSWQLAFYRRYGDRRFYKGVDYIHFVECLAQRRCAELFVRDGLSSDRIRVNVQPLSGAAANLAVYSALLEPGDTLMGLDLFQGGHLSHGSPFNISGQRYRAVSYGVDPATERLDYCAIRELARAEHPRVIVAGYTSYPWAPDWQAFRSIADEVGAYLVADIAHTAGMAAAGVYPSPLGVADVTTFTTHKTMCGPRGACILTTDEALAKAIDTAVFPGEQGGPHVNKFAAMAVAFRVAQTESFKALQRQIVVNAQALAQALQERGLRLAYGGTNTHLLLVDLKSVPAAGGYGGSRWPLWGEPAVRILDLAGIVANKNTIPGDTETALATGIRLGTPWISQRGLVESDMEELARLIHRVLTGIRPFAYTGLVGTLPRGKIALETLEETRASVSRLAAKAGLDFEYRPSGYPHFPVGFELDEIDHPSNALRVIGWHARQFIGQVATASVAQLIPGTSTSTFLLDRRGVLIDKVLIQREEQDEWGRDRYLVSPSRGRIRTVATWLRELSDGYVRFDDEDVLRKVEGPVIVAEVQTGIEHERDQCVAPEPGATAFQLFEEHPDLFDLTKPYFVGQSYLSSLMPVARARSWHWEPEETSLMHTPLYELHKALGAKMVPFAGWDMPVWYSSVSEEHRAVREAAGLFDVAHMGVFEVAGPHAIALLDTVCTNYVAWLEDGQSCYSYLLDPDGSVIDDVMVYRLQSERFLLVVNAANEAKDWDWLTAVNGRGVPIDTNRPWVRIEAPAALLNLKDPALGKRQRRDIALQGPASLPTLLALTDEADLRDALPRIRRTELMECELAGLPAILARTGYTGEKWGFEILVHPDDAPTLWRAILEAGAPLGVSPAGLGARDSTRTEAGLPLYGHELAGPLAISPIEAGFAGYVKYHKPFFVGRQALLAQENEKPRRLVVRFGIRDRGVRIPHMGDPVTDRKGQLVGHVTSCSLDTEGQLVGLGIVEKRCAVPGTPLSVFPLRGKSLGEGLRRGNRLTLPVAATVLARFPARSRHIRGDEAD